MEHFSKLIIEEKTKKLIVDKNCCGSHFNLIGHNNFIFK